MKSQQSVKDKLGKELTDRMKDEGELYWLNIQLDMMTKDEFWESKLNE